MAKSFNDFIFLDKRLSDLDSHYIAVDFDQDPDPSFAFAKDIEYGDTNRSVSYTHLNSNIPMLKFSIIFSGTPFRVSLYLFANSWTLYFV